MPLVFLFSAIISGVALLIVLYVLSCKLRKTPIDLACVKGLAYTVWAFIIVAFVLEGLEFANIVYKAREGIDMIVAYVTGPLLIPYFVLQFGIGAILPLSWLSYDLARHDRKSADRGRHGERVPGATLGVHDALERRHRRPGDLEDRQGAARISDADFRQGRLISALRWSLRP